MKRPRMKFARDHLPFCSSSNLRKERSIRDVRFAAWSDSAESAHETISSNTLASRRLLNTRKLASFLSESDILSFRAVSPLTQGCSSISDAVIRFAGSQSRSLLIKCIAEPLRWSVNSEPSSKEGGICFEQTSCEILVSGLSPDKSNGWHPTNIICKMIPGEVKFGYFHEKR